MDFSLLVPLLMAAGIPGALLAFLAYLAKRPRPKDQTYYETLIDTARSDADWIRAELERERGRRAQLEQELEKERQRAGELVNKLQKELDDCRFQIAVLQHKLSESESDVKSLRQALQRWRAAGGDAGA